MACTVENILDAFCMALKLCSSWMNSITSSEGSFCRSCLRENTKRLHVCHMRPSKWNTSNELLALLKPLEIPSESYCDNSSFVFVLFKLSVALYTVNVHLNRKHAGERIKRLPILQASTLPSDDLNWKCSRQMHVHLVQFTLIEHRHRSTYPRPHSILQSSNA